MWIDLGLQGAYLCIMQADQPFAHLLIQIIPFLFRGKDASLNGFDLIHMLLSVPLCQHGHVSEQMNGLADRAVYPYSKKARQEQTDHADENCDIPHSAVRSPVLFREPLHGAQIQISQSVILRTNL